MSSTFAIILTGILVAAACASLGCFLILRRMAMLADAISHAILPGLVAGYFIAQGPSLLAGFFGAALAGLITVGLVELLKNTQRVGGESAIGIVFPAMFALGTFLVSKYYADVHLDADAVLYGNIEFVGFDHWYLGETDLGPQSLWIMGCLCLINLIFISVFYKELKLATFDAGLAATLGFSPILIHYGLMAVVSITTVGAFTAVGAILVVALMIVPAATAYLLTDRLPWMIGLAIAAGAIAAVAGFGLAFMLNGSVAGAIATVTGVEFGLALLFSSKQGLVARAQRLARQRIQFAADTLLVHLLQHEGSPDAAHESTIDHLQSELQWNNKFAQRVLDLAQRRSLVRCQGQQLELTTSGRERSQQVLQLGRG